MHGERGSAESGRLPDEDAAVTLDRLRRERDAAEAASAAKSRYLASVSHEIRSPLNAIYGYAQLLERGAGIDPREAARIIRRSAEHLTDLVEGLLDISLVEHGVVRVAREVVHLAAFLDQIEAMFAPQAQAKGLAFRLEVQGPVPDYVRTDRTRLRQVLINLLANAIRHTERGEVVLSLARRGEVATFAVRDTGPGIDPARHETIFDPYSRGEEADETPQSGGAGLGLPISRAMARMLGGDIELSSRTGEGAEFRLRLMLPAAPAPAAPARPRGALHGYAGARRRVLVLDDDPRQRAFVAQALGDLGFDVAAAGDGGEARRRAAAGRFDAAVLDIALPGGDSGWRVARDLRAAHGESLAIVMLSANAHERHGLGAPAAHDRFLLKPVEIDTLAHTLGELLGLAWSEAAPAPQPEAVAGTPAQSGPLPEAAAPALGDLREALRIGHVRGIEGAIAALAAAAPEAGALVAQLHACLDRFDLQGLARLAEQAA